MTFVRPLVAVLAVVVLLAGEQALAQTDGAEQVPPLPIVYGNPKFLGHLVSQKVSESSGIAASRRRQGVFWTHNDSGSGAHIYAFDVKGADLGTFSVPGAPAHDWEDMASFLVDGKPFLLIADGGDNAARRGACLLHVVEEPELPERGQQTSGVAKLVRTLTFTYEDGAGDCEAVAVAPDGKTAYLIKKVVGLASPVYELPLADKPAGRLVAKRIAAVRFPMVTAMDMSVDGHRCVVLTYGSAFEFTRGDNEAWKDAFSRKPSRIDMPLRKQGESICYGADDKTLYVTSEGAPCPLWEVVPAPERE